MWLLLRLLLMLTALLLVFDAVVAAYMFPPMLIAYGIIFLAARRRAVRYVAYGTARFAEASDVAHLQGEGIILGTIDAKLSKPAAAKRLFDANTSADQAVRSFIGAFGKGPQYQPIQLAGACHTTVFAPPGSGKGVSICTPFLLTCEDSTVVLDYKGEHVRNTARHRWRMGQKVVIIDPFNVAGGKDKLNVLDIIGGLDDPTAPDACMALAGAIVKRTGEERETHFLDMAEHEIGGTLGLVAAYGGENRNLRAVRRILVEPARRAGAVAEMQKLTDAWDGWLAAAGFAMTHAEKRELGSIMTTCNRMTQVLSSPLVAASLTESTFDPNELVRGKMTVYLVLPAEYQTSHASLIRLWLTTLLMVVIRSGLSDRRVQFLIDEAATLGVLNQLNQAIDIGRGYGVRLTLIYQSIGQLLKCFPNGQDQTVLSNTTQIFFGVNDWKTAEYVSNRSGDFTQIVESGGESWGVSHTPGQQPNHSRGGSSNYQQAGRKLLQPSEVMALHPRTAITFHYGVPPIMTWLIRYYEGLPRMRPGALRAVVDSVALFLCSGVMAGLLAAALLKPK